MPSYRERLLSPLFGQLQAIPHAVAKRNGRYRKPYRRAAIPASPTLTLNPHTEFYSHRAEIETLMAQPAGSAPTNSGPEPVDRQVDALVSVVTTGRST